MQVDMEWQLEDRWHGVYATTEKWVLANHTVMTHTSTHTLVLLELNTMDVELCLFTGMYNFFSLLLKQFLLFYIQV